MQAFSNFVAQSIARNENSLIHLCLYKQRDMYQKIQQIGTKDDLIIKGYNLNQIAKDSHAHYEEDQYVRKLFNIPIHDQLIEFLADKYLHSCEQNLSIFILANLYCVGQPSVPPSDHLIKTIIHLVERGSPATIDSCLTLITNAAIYYPQWKLKLIVEHQICQVLCRSLARRDLERSDFRRRHQYITLKTMIAIIKGSPRHNAFKDFLNSLLPQLTYIPPDKNNVTMTTKAITFRGYVCFYYLSQMFPEEATIFAIQQNLCEKLLEIRLWFQYSFTSKINYIYLKLIQMLLLHRHLVLHKFTQAHFLQYFIRLIEEKDTIFQFVAYSVLIKVIEQKKISALNAAQKRIFEERLKIDTAEDILYSLAKIYVLAQAQAKDHKYSEKVKSLLEIVKCKFPQHITLIGYVDTSVSQFRTK